MLDYIKLWSTLGLAKNVQYFDMEICRQVRRLIEKYVCVTSLTSNFHVSDTINANNLRVSMPAISCYWKFSVTSHPFFLQCMREREKPRDIYSIHIVRGDLLFQVRLYNSHESMLTSLGKGGGCELRSWWRHTHTSFTDVTKVIHIEGCVHVSHRVRL
jgi:hypothetical protein